MDEDNEEDEVLSEKALVRMERAKGRRTEGGKMLRTMKMSNWREWREILQFMMNSYGN
ncbi:hypothetical protein BT69DRAFT_1333735 [Atractiella rhizophila]|nr:hypothetical protein BT69DRAFT_1333735 [Atractiella rhizophila]